MQVLAVEREASINIPSKEANAMIEWILSIDLCRAENTRR